RLELAASCLGFRVRYEPCGGKGGACVLRGERLIIIDESKGPDERLDVIARALADVDTEAVYLPPAVRQAIESRRGSASA
ncbi:MAG: hypothetical protein ACE5O2_03280, partial [Armatimonadota bacterium]